jgi:glycerate 2-kinase
MGKAATTLLRAVLDCLPVTPAIDLAGVLIAPEQPVELHKGFAFYRGGHPLPNEESFAAARAALNLLRDLSQSGSGLDDALCLYLISGGASAMCELSLNPDVTLKDVAELYSLLVHSGATITEINTVRKHLSAIKGTETRRHDTYFLHLLRAHSWAKFGNELNERGPATHV